MRRYAEWHDFKPFVSATIKRQKNGARSIHCGRDCGNGHKCGTWLGCILRQKFEHRHSKTGELHKGALDILQMPPEFGVHPIECGQYYGATKRHARRGVRNRAWGEARLQAKIIILCEGSFNSETLNERMGWNSDDIMFHIDKAQSKYAGEAKAQQGIRDICEAGRLVHLLCPRCGKMNILEASGEIPA